MKIIIETIPHNQHRYETCGDWWIDKATGDWHIRVSKMGDWRHEILVAMHELDEMALCLNDGVNQWAVDEFDLQYERERAAGQHAEDSEPGDDPRAPYSREHFFATTLERLRAAEMGIEWTAYEKAINAL